MERKLAAIIAADMVGFSRKMQADEVGTLKRLMQVQADLIFPEIASHRGRVFKTTGDGFFAEFASAIDALNSAVAIQQAVNARNDVVDDAEKILFRVGINIGDIILEGDDVFGDGVNIAARLEPLAPSGGIVVSDSFRAQTMNKVDVKFVSLGRKELKNITNAIDVYLVDNEGLNVSTEENAPQQEKSSDRKNPVLAILPFDNLSNDPEQDFFSDGISEDLITTLSQIAHLSVVSRNTAFTLKGASISLHEIGQVLNAEYVVTGSLRKSGNRIRISVQLADTKTEVILWTARYDKDLEDIFAVQDEITLTVATALQVQLVEGEQAKLRYTTTDNVAAWTSFIQGVSWFRTVNANAYRHARNCFEEALKADPDSAQIHAMLACVHTIEGRFYWTADRDNSMMLAKKHADLSLSLDEANADAWGALGYWHMCGLRHDDSIDAYSKAVDLAPDHADLHALFSLALTFSERPDDGIKEALTAIRLNPLDPGWYQGVLGHAYRYAGQFKEALSVLFEYDRQSTGFGLVDIVLTYADMGDADMASTYAGKLLEARPDFTIMNWQRTQNCSNPHRLDNDKQLLVDAGLPTG